LRLKLRFARKAKRSLATAKLVKLTVRISLADGAGNTAGMVRKVMLGG
jgi:hypothetical protein